MKKLNIYILVGLLFTAFACEETWDELKSFDASFVQIAEETSTNAYLLGPNAVPDFVTIELADANPASGDITITFEVSGDAVAGTHYNMLTSGNTITIPSGERSAVINYEVITSNFVASDLIDLTFTITDGGGEMILQDRTSFTNTLQISCESDLSGTLSYSYVSIAGQSASLPADGTVEWTVVDGGGVGEYMTTDASFGGLVFMWGAYGALPVAINLGDVCNVVALDGVDVWGDSYSYTISDVVGATMQVVWLNTYGDTGVVNLTRNDGVDWPALLGEDN